jgi:hypothetical protein
MKTLIKLSTVDLQVNGENQYGEMNQYRTSMNWKNLNFKQLFGDKLYNDSNYFSMQLVNVLNNTRFTQNNIATLPIYWFSFEDIQLGDVMNEGDYLNYGNGTIVGDVNIVSANKKNGGYSALFGQASAIGRITFPSYNITTTNGGYSLGFWFNLTDISIGKQTFYFSDYIYLLKLGTSFRYRINGVVSSFAYTYVNNTWTYIFMSHATDGTVNFYFNNVLINTTNIAYLANNTLNAIHDWVLRRMCLLIGSLDIWTILGYTIKY